MSASEQELTRLEELLPAVIGQYLDIERAVIQAEMPPGEVLPQPATPVQQWSRAVRWALPHDRLPLLLMRAHSQLGDRADDVANELRALIAVITTRHAADRLSGDVRQLADNADRLLGDHDAKIAAESALGTLRPPVRNVQERLDDEKFWPTLFPGMTGDESRVARDFLIDRCFDALRAIDALVALRALSAARPPTDADAREISRIQRDQGNALIEAKYRVVSALRTLHRELERYVALPTDPFE